MPSASPQGPSIAVLAVLGSLLVAALAALPIPPDPYGGNYQWPHVGVFVWSVAVVWALIRTRLGRINRPSAALVAIVAVGSALLLAGAWRSAWSLGWLPIFLGFSLVLATHEGLRSGTAELVAVILLFLAPVEGGLGWLASNPDPPGLLLPLARKLSIQFSSYVQLQPDCARFDPELGYTLRPGGCDFANAEYATRIDVNSLGLRDDEASLEAPEVVVLGDSFSMGWDVAESETYAAILESQTGRKVLNAAIPSYGTARQLLLLNRIDHSALEIVILQYCDNDARENLEYVEGDFKLKPRDESAYVEQRDYFSKRLRYWPWKYTSFVLRGILVRAVSKLWPPPATPAPTSESLRESDLVAAILDRHADKLEGVRVVIFGVSSHGQGLGGFYEELRERLSVEAEVVDIEGKLGPEDRFVLDPHLSAAGQRRVAELLSPLMD